MRKLLHSLKGLFVNQSGSTTPVNILVYAILAVVAIVVIYKFIPTLGNANVELQSSANVSAMTKTMGGIGEWLIPVGVILAMGLGAFFLIGGGRSGGRRRAR
jgi:hypothetical protein